MPKRPTLAIPLDLPDVEVLRSEVTPQRQLIIGVESTLTTTLCHRCGRTIDTFAAEVLPHAAIVIDRFHVAQHYRDDVDTFRKQELTRLQKELPQPAVERLKHTLWPFRKRAMNLEPEEQDRLDQLLAQSPDLEQAYDLREELTNIFDTTRAKAAGIRRIRAWRQKVVASGLTCFAPFLKLLDTWLDRIANYFRHHQNSGFVEGLNTKLKVLKRRCYGIYNLSHLLQRITLDLEGYRRFRLAPTHYM